MTTLSREAARALVGKIREDNGGISPEDRAACPPAVLRALENVRRKLGASTKTLATHLYSKDTRFVYELIQNAEDNNYTRAQAEGDALFLSFSIYPDRIVLDSNEDGFREENVKAICSTGESTKTIAQGYIGEKGIGFKSVFKVAKKVHIQSGPFSFSFEHTRDSSDDGLGMVTPLDEDFEDLPEGIHTRITLVLLDPSSFERRVQDLLNIPGTLVLFLAKLNVLHINIYPQDASATEIQYNHFRDEADSQEVIAKTTTIDGISTEDPNYFYVTRKEVSNLPHDEARKNTNQATVVLAFPVKKTGEPIIEQQHVYAFLPLRHAGFTFLIQSDFITQASREDVFHSPRNEHLLSSVAETFRDAVLQFCNHTSLQHKWMRYLPSDSISDEFWKQLRPRILAVLSETRCLRPWSETSFYLPRQLHRVTEDIKDIYGEPLFADLIEEGYLSRSYADEDFIQLKTLGTRTVNSTLLLARIKSDLGKDDSKMKAMDTEQDWHTKTATILSEIIANDNDKAIVKALDIIPLEDHRWISTRYLPIFLPTTEDVPIPSDLGLNLVQPAAALNTARKTLFRHLGVTPARPSHIISLISEIYRGFPTCTVGENMSHIRYLYWNFPPETLALDRNIYLIDQNLQRVYRTANLMEYVYFDDQEDEYGTRQLLQPYPLENPNAPGLSVHFLNTVYLDAVSIEALRNGRTWKLWLSEFASVQSYPQLRNPKLVALSDEFMYITAHRPEKLVGLLKCYWSFYEPKMISTVVRELRKSWVPSDAGSRVQLESTFLPLPRFKLIIETLKIVKFPFLILPDVLTGANENEWQFLKRFGVRCGNGNDDLHFYIEALNRIANESGSECRSGALEALFKVYSALEGNCSSADDVVYICDYFKSHKLIYIPSNSVQDSEWVHSGACVWTAPAWLTTKRRLDGVSKFADCEHLFRVILKIGDADWRHYLDDLKMLKEQNCSNTERAIDIYRLLWREFERDVTWEAIRTSFEESELVLVPSQNTWVSLSSCIWADDQVRIPRKSSIKTPYANLEDFFCRVLNVPKPNLGMHVQALTELAKSRPPPAVSEIKRMIMLISSMDPTMEDVKDLRRSKIFSVRMTNGQKTFTDTTADFAIVDRSEYGSAFAGKIRVLDFSIEEVRDSRSLLLALDLKRRHLSELVEETTRVQVGVINPTLSQNFRTKAYALFRCTVHFHSPRSLHGDKSLYDQLLGASIYLSDGIYKSIKVVQYGETVTVDNSRANFHLDEVNDGLRLYIPRDENAREECFFRQLPRRMMTYFAITDPAAEALLSGIIGCRSLIAVDGILKDAGIIEVIGIDRPSKPGGGTHQFTYEDVSLQSDATASTESQTSRSGRSTPVSTIVTIHAARSEVTLSTDVPFRDSGFNSRRSGPSSSPPSPLEELAFSMPQVDSTVQETGYAALLERVINSAGRLTIPTWGSHLVDNLDNALPLGAALFSSSFATRSTERDRKVGAAGELLIFEILLKSGLSGFTKDNWKSTIRKEVCVHTKYRNLRPWPGRETADITYTDLKGDFTKLLIEKGYLQSETWQDERPTYYLEVKTTTKDFREQFYMSGSQYERMQRLHLQPQSAAANIYVILRVFNIEGHIGLRVYVDPESSRRDGELDFNVDTWAVKPASDILV